MANRAVGLDEELFNRVVAKVSKDKIEYPTITNFVNKAVKELLDEEDNQATE